jgi:phenylacetate-CoA ligase
MLATPELIREAAQPARLQSLLPRWRDVPLYRDTLARTEIALTDLPVITKREMRAGFPHNFLRPAQALDTLLARQQIELEHTSGTSDDRLPVIFGHGWWNEQEDRALRLNALVARVLDEHPQARRATLTSPACNGLTCPTVWMSPAQRTIGNALFVNLARIPFVLGETEMQRMAEEIAAWSPQFLDLDPVHGAWFALFCERKGIRFPSLRFVLCSYEFVSVVHRRILQRVFGVPGFNLYGSTETGHLLMENEAGEMKASHDTALLEVVDEDAVGVGTLLVTTLSNDYMPLLRYRIGDLVAQDIRPYGTDYTVHGRARDVLTAADGRRVTTWQVDQCFADMSGMAHYQLRQATNGECLLRFVPESGGPDAASLRAVIARLESLLRSPVTTGAVPTLLPEASGKFRLTGSSSEIRCDFCEDPGLFGR